ncbi:hypothetical protein BRC62_06990 [Halobacteriales archaeon QH_10_67_13]|nr:MAG: hypothetical protein BRC62_06990 [Halobacteriales archaeon QH_10_67_13]
MTDFRRDALLAGCTLGGLVAVLAATDGAARPFDPVAVGLGVAGALAVEVAFLRSATVARLWRRPAVQLSGAVVVTAGGALSYVLVGPAAVVTLCWGIVTYFCLLSVVLAVGDNPLALGRFRR